MEISLNKLLKSLLLSILIAGFVLAETVVYGKIRQEQRAVDKSTAPNSDSAVNNIVITGINELETLLYHNNIEVIHATSRPIEIMGIRKLD